MERDDICPACRAREALQHAYAIDLRMRQILERNYETIQELEALLKRAEAAQSAPERE